MKKISLFLLLMVCAFFVLAQAPKKFTYQAVVRNASNQLVANTLVGVRVSILQNSAAGSVIYSETQMLSTNTNGLVTLNIGEGTVVYGNISSINWGSGTFFLKSEIDPNGGNNYSVTSTQQLMSVPYALYANEAGNGFSGDYNDLTNKPTIPAVPTNVSAFNNDAGYLTSYTETDPQFNAWDKNYNDLTNKPTIPEAANNATLTIQRNGVSVGTFTADASADETINVTVPTTTDELINNSGYITADQLTLLLGTLNSRMDSLQTLVSSQNEVISSLSGTVDSLETVMDDYSQASFVCGTSTVTDHEGNVYRTVAMGSQCWMAENLRTKSFSDGTAIHVGSTSDTVPQIYYPGSDSANVATHGYLYNWVAAMNKAASSDASPSGIRGICPKHWHVPSDAEWTTMENYVGSQDQYLCNENTTYIVKALATQTGWSSSSATCAPGNNPEANNATGFGALPAGHFELYGQQYGFGSWADFWTSTESSNNYAWRRTIISYHAYMSRDDYAKHYGCSVRCIHDKEVVSQLDTIIEDFELQIALLQSMIDTLETYLIEGNYLVPFECGSSTVSDYDGNVYNTVGIGNQCWMKENLRSTHYSDGTSIALGTSYGVSAPARYYPNHDSAHVSIYGYLYNWAAVMNGAASSAANPSGVHGICPSGWHVPSDAEWTQMENFVSSQNQYLCNNSTSNIAKAMASTTGWNSSSTACAVGNNPSLNNAVGFSAMPAGDCHYDWGYEDFGRNALFWTSTENASNGNAWRRYFDYNSPDINRNNKDKGNGFSIRCLHDNGVSGYHPTQNVGAMSTQIEELQARVDSLAAITDSLETMMKDCGCQPFVCGVSSVSDPEGNVYNTVKIGNQCWMAENLRSTRFSDGTAIALGDEMNATIPYRFYPYNDSAKVDTFGYLYNWTAVMNWAASSVTNPSGVRGICPYNWHVPSEAEWEELATYVSSQSQYLCNNNTSNIGKALAATTSWINSTTSCAVGNDQSTNNATGFGAMRAGNYHGFSYQTEGTYFWSSTQTGNYDAVYGNLHYNYANFSRSSTNKVYGHSVRCVRD